jgi:tRNA (guanine-N7-)-methyltransferase
MARRLAQTEFDNVRLIEADGEGVVESLLAEESVEEFWINFPDPWPKARHARRRIMQPPFVAQMASRLKDGGRVQVATDDIDYAQQIHATLAGEPLLRNALDARWLPELPGRPETSYEAVWRSEGRSLHFFSYERTPRSSRAASQLR